jgi:DhnA family fructose-bisphosphate aldolase class Ia
MTGKDIRFNKFLPEGENAVVVAYDHGEFFGPLDGVASVPQVLDTIKEADGLLISPGMVEHCKKTFYRKDSPTLIVRMNWASSYAFQWNYNDSYSTEIITPEEALALGVDIGLASCVLKSKNEEVDTGNMRVFAEMIKRKRHCGLPVVGEYYPVYKESLSEQQLHDQVAIACRVMSEVGADAVKTFYTGKNFNKIVADVPIPVLVLGADKLEKETDALRLAYNAVNDGARGVFFGRNVIQAKNPANFLKALKKVIKEGMEPTKAAKEYDLK